MDFHGTQIAVYVGAYMLMTILMDVHQFEFILRVISMISPWDDFSLHSQ